MSSLPPHIRNPESHFRAKMKYRYGITPEVYRQMLSDRNGICDVCGRKSERTLHVDHCHTTKKIRGMLCINCNRGIGLLGDDPEILKKAIKYLE